jgi:hypothetical protein
MTHAEGACLLPTYIYLYVTDTRKAFIATMACYSLRTDDVSPLILKPIKKIFLLHPLICSAACQSTHPIDPSSQSTFKSITLVVTSFLWTHWTATLKDWPDTKLNLDFYWMKRRVADVPFATTCILKITLPLTSKNAWKVDLNYWTGFDSY